LPHGPHPALGEGVGLRGTNGREDDPRTLGGEHGVEGARELGVAIADKEASFGGQFLCHIQVAGLLGDEGGIWVAGRGHHVDPTGPDLDEEQDVERLKERRFHREEVTGQDSLGLSAQELRPGWAASTRCRPEAVSPEQRADCRRPDPDAETAQLPLDPHTSPARVLPRQAKNQLTNLRGHGRAPYAPFSVCPLASDQFPVPAKEGRRGDQERRPALAREHAGRSRKEDLVQPPELRSSGFTREHPDLVAKNEDLDLALTSAFGGWHEPEQAAEDQIEEGEQHRGILREHRVSA
jgi:hypothetical protein